MANWDIIKVVILSLSMTLPTFMIFAFVLNFAFPSPNQNRDSPILALLLNAITFYPMLMIAYHVNLNFMQFLLILIAFFWVILVLIYFEYKQRAKLKQKSNEKSPD